MRSRLSIWLNELTLDEILHLEEEIRRRKERYRRNFAVLSLQTDRRILCSAHLAELHFLEREIRRFVSIGAAAGNGTMIAFSPASSVLLFNGVADASRSCKWLLGGVDDLNRRIVLHDMQVGFKLGVASGTDTLAADSFRCAESSVLVRRANQIAWRSTTNGLVMDEHSSQEWPDRYMLVPALFEIDGRPVYRLMSSEEMKGNDRWNHEGLMDFLRQTSNAGISVLHYHTIRADEGTVNSGGLLLILEANDPGHGTSITLKQPIRAAELADRMDAVRRTLSSMGLALVRSETTPGTEVAARNRIKE